MNPFLANALGAQETTLFKMVAPYAMFANGGERVEPTLGGPRAGPLRQDRSIAMTSVCPDCALKADLPAERAGRSPSNPTASG